MSEHYTLDENNNPIPCTLREWGDLYQNLCGNNKRRVGDSYVNDCHISTVFLGIDHGFGATRRPVLFETMVFDNEGNDMFQSRCCTWDEAVKMHNHAIEWVKEGCIDE